MISQLAMRFKLRTAVREAGGQKAWAIAHGISPQYVCDCLKSRRDIGISISSVFGFEPTTVYVTAAERRREELALAITASGDRTATARDGRSLEPFNKDAERRS